MPSALRSIQLAKTRASFQTLWMRLITSTEEVRQSSFGTVCSSDACTDIQTFTIMLLGLLLPTPAIGLLRSKAGHGSLKSNVMRIVSAAASDHFDYSRAKPLLWAVGNNADDALIWDHVYQITTESTPPPRPIASSLQQTPWRLNTSSFANSSEYRRDVDKVLRLELGSLHVGLCHFRETYFGRVAGLETASAAIFNKCTEGSDPLFGEEGWSGWPRNANQDDVLSWLSDWCEKLAAFAEDHNSGSTDQRRPISQPYKSIQGSTGDRKLDVGFVDDPKAGKDSRCHWSQILVPGELKSNPSADTTSKAWLDLGRYAREVLAAQDTRRFVLGFTICGSLMRIWEFDRLGGIASEQFNINKDGLQFVSTVLGFLWMSQEELGFDPTIVTANGERFIEIERNGSTERLIIDKLMLRASCISGRATTCWQAHHEGQPQTPLVIKDSWQFTERDEEGEMLREVSGSGVVNVARYYHHETVRVHGTDDDIQGNVRGGLDVTRSTSSRPKRSTPTPGTTVSSDLRRGRSKSKTTGKKRSSSQTAAALRPSKRSRSAFPPKTGEDAPPNRVRRRVVLRDYGKPIYKASSRSALLAALEGCIEGHESLLNAGFLHRDISINNLIINEDHNSSSWLSFLIDLDLAIRVEREGVSGASGKTGTRAFLAIGVLYGEQHSFMHDLESFFWVLLWICVHYDRRNKSRVVRSFEEWNYLGTEDLLSKKKGLIGDEGDFLRTMEDHFLPSYQVLAPWVNRLRRKVFPGGHRWKTLDRQLYSLMKEILRQAREDPQVLAGE